MTNTQHRGPQLRLVVDNERIESESASTSFEDIIAEIKGKALKDKAEATAALPRPESKSQLARHLNSFADDLDKQIEALLAM